MSRISFYYHLIIRTKRGEMTIPEESKGGLYAYLAGIVSNRGGECLRINGVGNHIHLLLRFRATVDFSALVHDIKLGGTHYIKTHREEFPRFAGWGKEYSAFTCSSSDQQRIINYINHQEEHHKVQNFRDEMKRFCQLAQIEYIEAADD